MKLKLWEGVLDETNLKFFRMKQKELGDRMSFTEEFAKMNAPFSRDKDIGARQRWEEVSIFHSGRIGTREWRDFEASFITAWHGVEGATRDEARRLLLQKIPSFVLNWITEEEERRSISNPTIRMNSPWEMSEDEVANSIFVLIGKKPTKASKTRGGDFEIVLPDFTDIDKMLGYNGKNFRNTPTDVKVSRVDCILEVEDIILLVNQEMTLKDRQNLLQSANQHGSSGKKTRTVNAESEGGDPRSPSPRGRVLPHRRRMFRILLRKPQLHPAQPWRRKPPQPNLQDHPHPPHP